MATKTVEKKKEFTMEQVVALWKKESKNGNPYFSGVAYPDEVYVTGFFNTNKKNPKEPDLRIYLNTKDGIEKEEWLSLWCNVSANGKKYLTGKLGKKRVVGFINEKDNSKAPYVRVYFSEDRQQKIETAEEPKEVKETQKAPF
jgi:uncharacterized protein (DUF736 family)